MMNPTQSGTAPPIAKGDVSPGLFPIGIPVAVIPPLRQPVALRWIPDRKSHKSLPLASADSNLAYHRRTPNPSRTQEPFRKTLRKNKPANARTREVIVTEASLERSGKRNRKKGRQTNKSSSSPESLPRAHLCNPKPWFNTADISAAPGYTSPIRQ